MKKERKDLIKNNRVKRTAAKYLQEV